MADTTSNTIKITGILNKYAWQNHELLPEELFQLLVDRKAVNDANLDRKNRIINCLPEDKRLQYKKDLEDFIFNKFTDAWHFPVTAGDISAIARQELEETITDETINNTLRKVMFSNALKTQEYRIQPVNAGALKEWAKEEQNVATKIAARWASILKDCLRSVKAYVDKETYAYLKNSMPSGEPKKAESVVELNDGFLQRITDNEKQRNKLKQEIKKLRKNGKISEKADIAFNGLLSETLSYVDILNKEHLQERREAFKEQNRSLHEQSLDTWFLHKEVSYKDKTLQAGFAGETSMTEADRKKLYTPDFILKLLQIAREKDIDLTGCYLPKLTPDNEDFAKILYNRKAPVENRINESGEKTLKEFLQHLDDIAPEIKEAFEVFAKEKATAFLQLLFRKLKTLWLQYSYRAGYFRFYLPKLGVTNEKQYSYYLIRGSELPDKDRILLLNALETGIPDQNIRRRIMSFIGKDLSLPRKNEEPDYCSRMLQDQKEEAENDLSGLLDSINVAICNKDKLRFEYGFIDLDGNRVIKQYMDQYGETKNKVYTVFPFGTVYQSGYFYMLAFFENEDPDIPKLPYTFRVDLMDNVEPKAAHGPQWDIKQIRSFEDWNCFDPIRYAKKHPHMYGEEKEENAEGSEKDSAKIIFRVNGNYVRYFRTAFGEDNCRVLSVTDKKKPAQTKVAGMEPYADKDMEIELNTSLGEAKIFALQYAPYCKVISPGDLVKEVKSSFNKVVKAYGLEQGRIAGEKKPALTVYNLTEKA